MFCQLCFTIKIGLYWIRDGHGPGQSMGWAGLGRDFDIFDGLGRVGSKTMGHLTQSMSIDDVYKMNISYQCIKK